MLMKRGVAGPGSGKPGVGREGRRGREVNKTARQKAVLDAKSLIKNPIL